MFYLHILQLQLFKNSRQLLIRTRLWNRLNIEEQILIVNYANTMMMKKTICSEDCSDALIDGLIEIIKGGGI